MLFIQNASSILWAQIKYVCWVTHEKDGKRGKNKIVEKISYTKHSHRNSGRYMTSRPNFGRYPRKIFSFREKNSKRFEWKLSYVVPSIKLNMCKAFIEQRMVEAATSLVNDPSRGISFNRRQLKREMNLCLWMFAQIYRWSLLGDASSPEVIW